MKSEPIIKLWELTDSYDLETTKENFEYIGQKQPKASKLDSRHSNASPLTSDQEYEYLLKLLGAPAKLVSMKQQAATAERQAFGLGSQGKRSKQLFFETFCVGTPKIDAITRTEWGGSFVFMKDLVWHVKGSGESRDVDYENWPRQIGAMFPQLPSKIDAAFFLNDCYFFTKVIISLYFKAINWRSSQGFSCFF